MPPVADQIPPRKIYLSLALPQENCNIYWDELAQLLTPTVPQALMICPQREELQLTRWLWQRTPPVLRVPFEVEDEASQTHVFRTLQRSVAHRTVTPNWQCKPTVETKLRIS